MPAPPARLQGRALSGPASLILLPGPVGVAGKRMVWFVLPGSCVHLLPRSWGVVLWLTAWLEEEVPSPPRGEQLFWQKE